MSDAHGRIETLGGALALGEASGDECEEYRAHLAHCAECVRGGSGEIELARLSELIGCIRDSETWTPDVSTRLNLRMHADRRRAARFAAGALGTLTMLPFLIYASVNSGVAQRVESVLSGPSVVRSLVYGFSKEGHHFRFFRHDPKLFETP